MRKRETERMGHVRERKGHKRKEHVREREGHEEERKIGKKKGTCERKRYIKKGHVRRKKKKMSVKPIYLYFLSVKFATLDLSRMWHPVNTPDHRKTKNRNQTIQ